MNALTASRWERSCGEAFESCSGFSSAADCGELLVLHLENSDGLNPPAATSCGQLLVVEVVVLCDAWVGGAELVFGAKGRNSDVLKPVGNSEGQN